MHGIPLPTLTFNPDTHYKDNTMSELSLIRHLPIFDPSKTNPPIHIIGAGATGSRLWLSLVELGLTNISIYDFDKVEAHNLANQIFLNHHIGMTKVDALADYYVQKTGREPLASFGFYNVKVCPETTDPTMLNGIVFLLTDTMESRKDIMQNLIEGSGVAAVIETRMASSYGNVNVINPFDAADLQSWYDSLINDDEAEVSACGASISVGPTASIIANLAVWEMIHLLQNQEAVDKRLSLHLKPVMINS